MRLVSYNSLLIILTFVLLLTSCEKVESPVVLPVKGGTDLFRVDMGEEYENQIFFDFSTRQVVMTSKVNSWDLAFDADPKGYHVFMNGGKNIFITNTHTHNPAEITAMKASAVADSCWKFDAPSGMTDSTGLGEWRDGAGNSKKEVFIVKFHDGTYKKIILLDVNNASYTMAYGDIASTTLDTIEIPKDPTYNYAYFSFANNGKLVLPEPPKESWDIVFTRYRYIYYDLNNFPYSVNGVLLNPFNTAAAADSVTAFSDITYSNATPPNFSTHRDVIGWDWKLYNFNTGMYEVKPWKNYVLKSRTGYYWKLHFVDFYGPTGMKGSPSFEFERIH